MHSVLISCAVIFTYLYPILSLRFSIPPPWNFPYWNWNQFYLSLDFHSILLVFLSALFSALGSVCTFLSRTKLSASWKQSPCLIYPQISIYQFTAKSSIPLSTQQYLHQKWCSCLLPQLLWLLLLFKHMEKVCGLTVATPEITSDWIFRILILMRRTKAMISILVFHFVI